jgi:hypothetical protein
MCGFMKGALLPHIRNMDRSPKDGRYLITRGLRDLSDQQVPVLCSVPGCPYGTEAQTEMESPYGIALCNPDKNVRPEFEGGHWSQWCLAAHKVEWLIQHKVLVLADRETLIRWLAE